MFEPLRDTELVTAVEDVQRQVRDGNRDAYDGLTENGPGTFMVVLPGRTAGSIADQYDVMDPLPWADTGDVVSVDPDDPAVPYLVQQADRYTDGALLVEGDGRIYPYTVELEPAVRLEDRYEDGWGTKTRAALNMSAVRLSRGGPTELDYLRRFPESQHGHVDAAVRGGVWEVTSGEYGDIVSVTTSSKTGQVSVFDRGRMVRHAPPVEPSRDLDDIWDVVRAEAAERAPTGGLSAFTVADQYVAGDRHDRNRIEDLLDPADRDAIVSIAPDVAAAAED